MTEFGMKLQIENREIRSHEGVRAHAQFNRSLTYIMRCVWGGSKVSRDDDGYDRFITLLLCGPSRGGGAKLIDWLIHDLLRETDDVFI